MKRKSISKLCFLIIAVVLLNLVFAGCTNTQKVDNPKETTGTEGIEHTQYTIGTNNFLKGIYSLDVLENFCRYTVADAYGNEFISVNDEAQVEKLIQNVEYQISSGVDGLILFGIVDTIIPTISSKCEEAKVPFVLFDHIPAEDILSDLKENPYFAGIVGERDYDAGYPLGEYLAIKGCKKAIIITGTRGDATHEARTKGFTDSFTAAGGEVLDVGWTDATLAQGLETAEDMLTAHPDIDCIYSTSGDLIVGAMQALEKHAEINAILVGTDLDPTGLEGLQGGAVSAINGAHWINSGFSAALLQNYLDGHAILDKNGQAPVITVPIIVLPKEQSELYKKFWLDSMPFTVEEMQSVAYRWNPDVTLDYIQNMLNKYSIKERLLKRLEEGKVTADELKAVGISVN